MQEITIKSFAHFIEIIEANDRVLTVYRGEPENPTPLVPKIGRLPDEKKKNVLGIEEKLFTAFKLRAERHLSFTPATEIEWLAVAQHYGLPTRLLDWSESALVAAFFAIRRKGNGCVYSTDFVKFLDDPSANPFTLKESRLIRVPARFDRVQFQLGLFSVDPTPVTPFNVGVIRKLIIPEGLRTKFLDFLCKLGVTDETLFPGLDGLSRYLTWSRDFEEN